MSVLTWSMCHAGGANILIYEVISCHRTNLILRNININHTITVMKGHIIKRFGYLRCGKGHLTVECMVRTYRYRSWANKMQLCTCCTSKALSWNNYFVFWFSFHWCLLQKVILASNEYWFKSWMECLGVDVDLDGDVAKSETDVSVWSVENVLHNIMLIHIFSCCTTSALPLHVLIFEASSRPWIKRLQGICGWKVVKNCHNFTPTVDFDTLLFCRLSDWSQRHNLFNEKTQFLAWYLTDGV